MRIILECSNANSGTPNPGGQASFPPPVGHGDQRVAEMQFRGDDPNTDIASFNGELALPSADPDDRGVVLDSKDSLSESADSDFSSTEPSRLSQPSSVSPRGFWRRSGRTNIHSKTTKSILSFAVNQRLSSLPSFVFCFSPLHYSFFVTRYTLIP